MGLILPIFTSCKAQKEIAEQADQKIINLQPQALEKSLLWKVEADGVTEPSYVYGTIHIIDGDNFFYPDGTLAAIDACDKMVFEIDMAEMNDMSNMMGLMNKAFMNDNLELKDLVDSSDYVLVQEHFKKLGLPFMMFKRMKPMFLTVFAGGDMNPMDIQSGKMKSYEMEFMQIAEQSDMATGGLETIEFQISVFDSIPYQAQADMLIEAIKVGDTGGDQFKEMIEMYRNQDISSMVSMIDEDESMGDYNDVLLANRNKNWIPLMKEMMIEQPTFFAVGAGHLAGKEGVLNLLKKEGLKLTPMSMSDGE